MIKRRFCVAWVLSVTALIGCGQSGPAVHPVSGTVTVGGKPVQNVQVTFMPTEPSRPIASGNVDADGRYVLTSGATNRSGAVAGAYKVVLSQLDGASQQELDARYTSGTGGPPPVPKAAFPDEYKSAETSPKQVDVAAGSNTINIEIP